MLAGDFNINLLHSEQNEKVQNFITLILQFGSAPYRFVPGPFPFF